MNTPNRSGYSLLLICLMMTQLTGCNDASVSTPEEEERYRPNVHFTPAQNWMNDPNGMFHYKGKFHLFFQYNPNSNVWGPMHWGHATSEDGLHWEEHPIALYPDENGTIFSGSAVVDHHNTSGFGTEENPPIVAVFTYHNHEKEKAGEIEYETQGIAYSLDEGMTWTKYEGNPVIPNPGIKDFRDPKVFWLEAQKKWVMVLAAGQEVQFFESLNLKEWTKLSSFGVGIGNHQGVWECPDLVLLPVEGTETYKWVLLVSVNPGGPNGGSATQYFVGDFDGKQFSVDATFANQMEQEHSFWVDFGRDNYAGVTYNNIETKEGGRLFQGWMSNWQYANQVPTTIWRSAMTLLRKMTLISQGGRYRLKTTPYLSNSQVAQKAIEDLELTREKKTLLTHGQVSLSATFLTFEWEGADFELNFSNTEQDELKMGFQATNNSFYVDRMKAGKHDFSEQFASHISTAPRLSDSPILKTTLVVDKTSVEVFFDDGQTVFTEIFFLKAPFETLTIEGTGKLKKGVAFSLAD